MRFIFIFEKHQRKKKKLEQKLTNYFLHLFRFFVPTHVEPRYTPAGSTPTPDSNFSTSTSTMTANITVFAASQIESIESPSHTIETSINGSFSIYSIYSYNISFFFFQI